MRFIFLFVVVLLIGCSTTKDHFKLAAEWEPHEAVWVGVFQRPGRDTVSAEIIKAIYQNVQVKLNYNHDSVKNKYNPFFSSFGIDTSRLQWIKDSALMVWIRDPGPLFLMNRKGQQKVLDFDWNYYGVYLIPGTKYSMTKNDTLIGSIDQRMGSVMGLPVVSANIVAEGGGIDNNGDGVLLTIEETALQRNPGKTLAEIEAAYKQATGCQKIIWLKRMTIHDKRNTGLIYNNWSAGGANGHVDEMARFINKNTIAIAKIDEAERNINPISKADYDILEENYELLKNATDAKGKSFNIIRFPYPDLDVHAIKVKVDSTQRSYFEQPIQLKDGDFFYYAPAVSYMNFMVTNGVVLIANYWKEGLPLREKEKDEKVLKVMQQYYPDRKIIQINPYQINRGGGGIHCATQQQPKRKK